MVHEPEIQGPQRNQGHRDHSHGQEVHIRRHLERLYDRGRWRKKKGIATVELADGTIGEAEIHWYEAHGIGRKDFKIKRVMQ